MFDYYYIEYKKYIVTFIVIFSISIFYFYEDIVDGEKVREKTIVENKTYEKNIFFKDEIEGVKRVEDKEIIFEVIKKNEKSKEIVKKEIKKVILYSTSSNENRYSLKLASEKKIKNFDNESKQIVVTGDIISEYSKVLFSMSINENFIKDTSLLTLIIEDRNNNIKSSCEGYFLDSLTSEYSYHMKIELVEDTSDCFILSQSDFIEEDYSREEKEYVEIKDGVMGILSDKKIEIDNNADFNKLKISKFED